MKHKIRSAAALLLALCMALGLAGCGDKGGSTSEKPADGGTAQTPEYVYTASFTTLFKNSEDFPSPKAVTGDGFYAVGREKVGENIPEGAVPDYEGQFDVFAPYISFSTFDGQTTRLENYVPAESDIDSAGKINFASSTSINFLLVNADGTLTVLEDCYTSWFEAPDGMTPADDSYYDYYRSEDTFYLRVLDTTGTVLSSVRLDLGDEQVYIYNAVCDEKGNLIVITDQLLTAFAPDGSKAYEISFDGYIYSLVKLSDGRAAVMIYENAGGLALKVIDPAAGDFSSQNFTIPYDAYDLISGGGDYDLYYTSGVNFFGYSLAEQRADKLFSWLSCDVDSSDLGLVNVDGSGNVSGFIRTYNDKANTWDMDYFTVDKVPYDPAAQKKTLSMAVMYIDDNIQKAILSFNRSGGDYRIEVTDYSEFNTEEDYSAGMTKLTTEIMSGDMPDILALGQLPYRQMAAKGLLADLYPYLDGDGTLSRDDFFPNVLSALEVDGGLYCAPGGFSVVTAVGASSVVGDEPGWTYDDYYAALATMPEGCEGFDVGYDRNSLLTICLVLDLDEYMDWSTGECRFDSEDFVKLLEFAASGGNFDYDRYEYSRDDSATVRIQQGRQMLTMANFSGVDFMYEDYDKLFGGKATFVGFPTLHGVGSLMSISDGYCISSACPDKDAAWQFVRTVLTDGYQSSGFYLPTNKNTFEEQLAASMVVEYLQDANGNYLLDENGERIPQSKGGFTDGINSYEIYATTEAQAEQLRSVIASATKLTDYDESIISIVTEQAAAYFSGQKSAQEVAKLIQSKASIYINEQK